MKYLISEAKHVAESFYALVKSVHERSVFSTKQNELILIAVFTANKARNHLKTHIRKALENGATKDEVISSILLALPVIGITRVNEALEVAIKFMETRGIVGKAAVISQDAVNVRPAIG
jgi:alkylhydroperoxidase/carboxymuconolactone decarboxylase family protein YurZ